MLDPLHHCHPHQSSPPPFAKLVKYDPVSQADLELEALGTNGLVIDEDDELSDGWDDTGKLYYVVLVLSTQINVDDHAVI